MRSKLLIIILLLAAILRFIGLGTNPPSLNWDEIAIGWNAYSILSTGKDEFGQFLPSSFRSFDDYKSPAYIYSVVPALIIFGKTEFAIRFPSALAGTLTVLVLYQLVKILLSRKINASDDITWTNRSANIALLSAGILAITPWHVHFSRVAFESNFALFWEMLGAYLFLLWIKSPQTYPFKKKLAILIAAVLSFGVALYSYASARLFVALLLLVWGIYFRRQIWQQKASAFFAVCIAIIISIPLIIQMVQGEGFTRYQATSIVNRPEIYERNKEQAVEDYKAGHGQLSVIVHNVRIPIARQIIQNYLDHYIYSFLFVKADLPRHQVPGFGLLYLWQLPLILVGAVFLIKNRKYLDFVPWFWWLVIAPFPAALTWQVPHSIRAQLMLPILTLLSGAGLWSVLKLLQQLDLASYARRPAENKLGKLIDKLNWFAPKALFITVVGILILSTASLAQNYHTNLPPEFAKYWLYGRKEMVLEVEKEKDKFDTIVIDLGIDWAYLWFLWYGNYTPQWYLDQGGTVSGGFQETQNKVGKIQFKEFDFDSRFFGSEELPDNSLFIGLPEQFPAHIVPYKKINDPAGNSVIYIVKT